jgi:hypothetical protein
MKKAGDNARAAFRSTVQAVREKLLLDIRNEADLRYSLQAKDRSKIRLRNAEAADWEILKDRIPELETLVREKAYTTANRLAFLFTLEARGLRSLNLVLKGTARSSLRDNAEFFADLLKGADQGWAYVLDQVWDSLALDLPALFARSAVMDALPVPGPTLVWLINEFAKDELAEVWLDDTTPGWLYQYWNDPDRKAVDEKLKNTTGKVEACELAHKTQLFTERYMVEWLVQNSLGAQWLALCKKHGWHFTVDPTNDFWKFYVDAEISADSIKYVPNSLSEFKVLDPAMGSGHFLVYVFDFLYELYQQEATFTDKTFSAEEAVDSILCNNLHGIDIDNRAVQIAAASLLVKAREHAPAYAIRKLNLVATDLGLLKVRNDDPALAEFIKYLQEKAGLLKSESESIIQNLKSADYMGSLLQVNELIKELIRYYSGETHLESTIQLALKRFLRSHDNGNDLGIHNLAEQLDKGLRLIMILGQQYDVIVANPPYLGLAKSDEKINEKISNLYPKSCTDLYGVFIERSFQLSKDHASIAMVTMQNFMFLSSFADLRNMIYSKSHILNVAHLGAYAFQELRDHALAVMFVLQYGSTTKDIPGVYQRYLKPKDKAPYLLSQKRTYRFLQERFADIPGSPMIYWWPEEFRQAYLKAKKLGEVGDVRLGMNARDNQRFVFLHWEVKYDSIMVAKEKLSKPSGSSFVPILMGAKGARWFDTISNVQKWKDNGLEAKQRIIYSYPYLNGNYGFCISNEDKYFTQGISFNSIGVSSFSTRLRKYCSIFSDTANTIFLDNPECQIVFFNSSIPNLVLQSLNPTIHNTATDISNLPVFDFLSDWKSYLDRARVLYDEFFASTETNIEYRYRFMDPERFEVEEARIRDEIDKEILARFTPATVAAIYEEIGESPFNLPMRKGKELPVGFDEAYLASESILALAKQLHLHPDSVLEIKNERRLVHPAQRTARAFQHLSWALGVLLGRFDFETGGLFGPGIEAESPDEKGRDSGLSQRTWSGKPGADGGATATTYAGPHPSGLIYLSALDGMDGLPHRLDRNVGAECEKSVREILKEKHGSDGDAILEEIDEALVRADRRESLAEWMRLDAFARHKELYENRPIYFPLASAKKNFLVWVNIHRWNEGTLNDVLANYLNPDRDMLEARVRRLREDSVHADTAGDKKLRNEIEDTVTALDKLREELSDFASLVNRLATVGPDPKLQEASAPFVMDLDDGVMVNSAALWELVAPLWKDPKKWWEILSKPAGKKDFDWSHLAMRYWPDRVFAKVKKDPSLAVAHSDYGVYKGRDLFRELHPEAAKKWDEQKGKKEEKKYEKRDDGEFEF